jgi:hypothetical protein
LHKDASSFHFRKYFSSVLMVPYWPVLRENKL